MRDEGKEGVKERDTKGGEREEWRGRKVGREG